MKALLGTRSTPIVPIGANGMKATWIEYGKAHQWKKLGVVVLHDAKASITLNAFDGRYRGKKSRYGQYIRDLHAAGVDVSGLILAKDANKLEKEKEEVTVMLAKRLYEALVKRTTFKRVDCHKCGVKPGTSIKTDEVWDWKNDAAKHSKYYKMAVRILKENDEATAIRIVNTITGYA